MGMSCAAVFEAGMHYRAADALAYPLQAHSFARYKLKKDAEQKCIGGAWGSAGEFALYAALPGAAVLLNAGLQDEYVSLLLQEMQLYAPLVGNARSLGYELCGTDALLLSADNMRRIADAVRESFTFKDDVAFSLSADVPSALHGGDALRAAVACGYQRLSLLLEASAAEDGRDEEAFREARRAGFSRINLELPCCLPMQDPLDFEQLLQRALSLEPEYITLCRPASGDAGSDVYQDLHQYRIAYGLLTRAGYRSTRGKRTFTKIDYDYGTSDYVSSRIIKGVPHFGIGVGARSFGPGYESRNFSGENAYARYRKALLSGQFPVESVYALPPEECMALFVLHSLSFGFIDLKAFQRRFGTEFTKVYAVQVQFLNDRQLMEKVGYRYCLTERGVDYLHGIAPLFYSPQEKKLLPLLLDALREEEAGADADGGVQDAVPAGDAFGVRVVTAALAFRMTAPENYRRNSSGELSVLLVRKDVPSAKEHWALPAAYMRQGEQAVECAARGLSACTQVPRTGICCIGMAESGPDVMVPCMSVLRGGAAKEPAPDGDAAWFSVRLSGDKKSSFRLELSCGEETLSATARAVPGLLGTMVVSCRSASGLAAPDAEVLVHALLLLRERAEHFDVLFEFLPRKFTLAQLQQLQELLLGQPVIAPNFRRKAAEFVTETDEYDSGTGHRPAKLFVRR
ncbi:MAG: hypothetical protein II187_04660 [Treponema sp.]|nr:hypothetical protein [Treponema sp.]